MAVLDECQSSNENKLSRLNHELLTFVFTATEKFQVSGARLINGYFQWHLKNWLTHFQMSQLNSEKVLNDARDNVLL